MIVDLKLTSEFDSTFTFKFQVEFIPWFFKCGAATFLLLFMEVGSIRIPLGVDKTKAHVENI